MELNPTSVVEPQGTGRAHDLSKPPIRYSEVAQPANPRTDDRARPDSRALPHIATEEKVEPEPEYDSSRPLSTTHKRIVSGEVLASSEPAEDRPEQPQSMAKPSETEATVSNVSSDLVSSVPISHVPEKQKPSDLKFFRSLNPSNRKSPASLAHIRVGLHAQEQHEPVWQYALLDCGASDNLISLKTVTSLPNFDKLVINTSTSAVIRTANNDMSQQVHGKVSLCLSLHNSNGERICYRSTFLIVSGLIHDIFLGQPFVSSPQMSHQDSNYLYFHSSDQVGKEQTESEPENTLKHAVPKIYNLHRKLTTKKKITIPPKTAQKISTNLVEKLPVHSEIFYSAHPTQKFRQKYPNLHLIHQVVNPAHSEKVQVMVLNTSDKAVTIDSNRSLAHLETHFKSETYVDDLNSFLPSDETNCTSDKAPQNIPSSQVINLNHVVIEHNNSKVQRDHECCECNSAYASSSFHEHELTPQEKEERNKQYRMEGYFQKSVSEVIENSSNFPCMTFEGDNQFKAKTSEELLSECDLTHLSESNRKLVIEMLKRNISAFQTHSLDIGECKGITAYAPLTEPNPPILYAKYRPIPLAYKAAAQKLIDQYVAAGVLAPTTEPCTFTSNIFIIPKKDGTFRLIFDGRVLSRYCKQLPLSLGSFDEIFSNLQGKTLVTKLDLSKAYDQLKVSPETSKLLSFFGPDNRRYKYLRAGQGLKFSSFFLNQAMEVILEGLEGVTSYCDDIFIATSGTFEEHLKLLETVIKRFASYNVKLSIAKMDICPEQLDFLGLTWRRNKLSIPDSKIMAYKNMKKPTSLKEARFIVNSTAFYRRFIPNFSKIVSPILDLLKTKDAAKNFKKLWQDEHQRAIDKLVESLKDGVSLYLPRKDEPFIIHSDASYVAAAATVSQYDDEGELRLVAAVSRTFIKSERSLAPIHKEILSLLYALTSLNYILRGAQIKVFADARSITLLKTCSASSPYLARLAMELSVYDFELYHLPGQLNIVADALSRMGKTQEEILQEDKTKNNAMTKQESLEFLEFLTIPSGTRYTVSEVKHLLRSEPLRSELKARVSTRLASSKKSFEQNAPNTIKPKKTHQPIYTKSHPLERNSRNQDEGRVKTPSRSRTRSHSRARSPSSRFSANQRNPKTEKKRNHSRTRSRSPLPQANQIESHKNDKTNKNDGPMRNEHSEPLTCQTQKCETECQSRIDSIVNGTILATCTVCLTASVIHPVTFDGDIDGKSDVSYSESEDSSQYDSDGESESCCESDYENEEFYFDGAAFIRSELDDENGPENIPLLLCESHNCAIHDHDESTSAQPPENDYVISESDLNSVLTDADRFYERATAITSPVDTSYPFEIPPPLDVESFFPS